MELLSQWDLEYAKLPDSTIFQAKICLCQCCVIHVNFKKNYFTYDF